jgi:TfoX/Sxy family transcriptional regulator of competence genes
MASDRNFVEFVAEQLRDAGEISFRKMFGEYAVYLNGKVIMLVCDNRAFFKPTDEGKAFLGEYREAHPYPQAKPHILADDFLDDGEKMAELAKITGKALPEPKPKKKKARPRESKNPE